MRYTQGKYPIITKSSIAAGIFDLTILCKEVAEIAVPGQFVHVLADGHSLRRPISIASINKEKGTIRIIFEVRGKGTGEISKLNVNNVITSYSIHYTKLYDVHQEEQPYQLNY